MVAWPSHFPLRPPDGSWAIQINDPVVRNETERGPPMSRRRASIEFERWQGTLTLTRDEYEQLRTFWKTDCTYGSANFTMKHWVDMITEVTMEWAAPPGPVEHVAKGHYRVGINLIRRP